MVQIKSENAKNHLQFKQKHRKSNNNNENIV